MSWHEFRDFKPYVPVAERRRRAAKKVAKLKRGGKVSPVEIAGRKIATTFWGEAWCTNLEAYSDFANRLPRGRTYARNGSVVDLEIEAGRVRSYVAGSELYTVDVWIKHLSKKRWGNVKGRCAGRIDSLVELLRGRISKRVMEIVTRKGRGLFPEPREIELDCSCPDWASLCKHVAATLYGVGARLDKEPELLFTLRGVDPNELVEAATARPPTGNKAPKGRVLATDELSSVFGVDIDMGEAPTELAAGRAPRKKRVARGAKKSKSKTAKTKRAPERPAAPKRTKKKANPKRVAAKAAATKKPKKVATKKGKRKKAAAKKRAGARR